jgi:hypothetical protein
LCGTYTRTQLEHISKFESAERWNSK